MENKIMSNKQELLVCCISRARSAYYQLNVAKTDCDQVVNSEIEQLVASCDEKITAADKKNIKKIAKALADEKIKPLTREAMSLSAILLGVNGRDE